MTTDRTIPHDLAAETALLGAIMVHSDLLGLVVSTLQPTDFFRDGHRRIYATMLEMSRTNTPIDALTLLDALGANADAVGGPAYLMGMLDGVPRSANVEAYAKIVREKAALRALISAATDMMGLAYDAEMTADAILDEVGQKILELGHARAVGVLTPVREIVRVAMERLEERVNNPRQVQGLETGFHKLDGLLHGLKAGQLIIVAARPSMGKTSLVLNMASHMSGQGKKLAFFSLEMQKDELADRLLASVAQVNGGRLARGFLSDIEMRNIGLALDPISAMTLHIDDSSKQTMFEIRSKARAMKQSTGLDGIIVDYLQLMDGDASIENRNLQVAALSRGMKQLAKDLSVPVICLSQLSRKGEGRQSKEPELSDLRDSGAIEQDADVVIFIHKEKDDDDTAVLLLKKQRNGPKGASKVSWHEDQTRFSNIEGPSMID